MEDQDSMSSDSDDEDYAPDEGSGLDSDEEASELATDIAPPIGSKRKQGEQSSLQLKRSTDSKSTLDEEHSSSDDDTRNVKEQTQEDKSRLDELWAGFKKDVGSISSSKSSNNTSTSQAIASSENKVESADDGTTKSKMITIKKTFDFAGEDVIVERTVEAGSKEAIDHEQVSSSETSKVKGKSGVGGKKVLGAKALLQSLNKKPKISTLDKSRLDWDKYKSSEGIEEELQFHKKDGYLEKKEFLARTDMRQFEQEREERAKRFKKLY